MELYEEKTAEYRKTIDTLKKAKMPAEKLYASQRLFNETEHFYTEISSLENLDMIDADTASRAASRLSVEQSRIEQIVRVRKNSFNAAVEEYNTGVLDSPVIGWLLRLLGFQEMEKIY